MPELTLDSTVVRAEDVMASPVDDELVMMDLERGVYYSLDRVGADIWNRLAQPVAVADLCSQLMQKYAVDQETCETDVLAVLNDMAANGLLAEV
ncbi:lasso peptide biosynthesis PqqD family chaperone [Candidatus Chloroploca sp. Khr17]|uniref:lasso peptide biosynthesis PqqD family chaperone n=1 Tax=Candidatus Chloroploca sp. Khr17 TaxID=2496869 RepID=UPI00101C2131|nr:lasso peptide biosynthesis PqqD family chaperone [Candidatus Chloroploca sp. Khr17]